METDIHGESNGSTVEIKENGFILYPVSVNDSGEGLPYAPIDWPNPGDKWSWRVGKRTVGSGYFHDRYLYLPRRLWGHKYKRRRFASKFAVEQYIRSAFPGADVNAFFASFSWKIPSASFSWKIPSKKLYETKGNEEGLTIITEPAGDKAELSGSDSQFRSVGCKAGNRMCISLAEAMSLPSEAMVCDVCCSEPGFCRDCCCILCCKTIDLAYGGYSFIRCEATVVQGFICGHVAHIDCGLRSHMAGTVGGSIGLDAEYYCRRCDARTGLISHVTKLLQNCESIDSRDDIQKILNIGVGILRGSQKSIAKRLLDHMELVMAKLKSGTYSKDVWKMEDISAVIAGMADQDEVMRIALANKKRDREQKGKAPKRQKKESATSETPRGSQIRSTPWAIQKVVLPAPAGTLAKGKEKVDEQGGPPFPVDEDRAPVPQLDKQGVPRVAVNATRLDVKPPLGDTTHFLDTRILLGGSLLEARGGTAEQYVSGVILPRDLLLSERQSVDHVVENLHLSLSKCLIFAHQATERWRRNSAKLTRLEERATKAEKEVERLKGLDAENKKLRAEVDAAEAKVLIANVEVERVKKEAKDQLENVAKTREAEIKAAVDKAFVDFKDSTEYKAEVNEKAAGFFGHGYDVGVRAVAQKYPNFKLNLEEVEMDRVDVKAIRAQMEKADVVAEAEEEDGEDAGDEEPEI